MSKKSFIDSVKVGSPCSEDWGDMKGNDRVRFCSQCNLNVYNLSGMRREEAESLIAKTEGRLCVRFYRKADGSILTQNCPVGLKAIKRRVAWIAQVALGMALIPRLGACPDGFEAFVHRAAVTSSARRRWRSAPRPIGTKRILTHNGPADADRIGGPGTSLSCNRNGSVTRAGKVPSFAGSEPRLEPRVPKPGAAPRAFRG